MRGYEISEEVKSEGLDYKNFLPGINENLVLKSVSYGLASPKPDADPSGPKALIFEFNSADGEVKYRHTEWEIVESREIQNAEKLYDTLVQRNDTPSEPKAEFVNKTVDKAYVSQQKRIKHILTKFMDESEVIIPASKSFAEFANNVAKLATPKLDGRSLRAIFVYDNKGYLKFPSFVPFLEIQVAGVDTSLKVNPTYHKITPPKPSNSSAVGSSSVSDQDEF